jgi:UPF0271 protein
MKEKSMEKYIDINADMGESYGNFIIGCDSLIMPLITSANVACGFHGGDPVTMKETIAMAKTHGVKIGAHHAFADLQGFGRREIKISAEELYTDTVYQVGAIKLMCEVQGMHLHHIKPHGALYNLLGKDKTLAAVYMEAIRDIDSSLPLYHAGSLIHSAIGLAAKQKGIRFIREFNADTDYSSDGLVAIKKVHEKIDSNATVDRVINFLETGNVQIGTGETLTFVADSICVHGDNPSAAEMLTTLRTKLIEIGYQIKSV